MHYFNYSPSQNSNFVYDTCRSEVEIVSKERDVLVRKLVEAEMGAKSTSHLVLQLKETVSKLKEVSFNTDINLSNMGKFISHLFSGVYNHSCKPPYS